MQAVLQEINVDEFDVIIVGTGPAGTTLARELNDAGVPNVIFEAARERFDADLQNELSDLEGIGHFTKQHWPQHWQFALGGTSRVWGGWSSNLDRRDFDKWPISISDLRPGYARAADILGRSPSVVEYVDAAIPNFNFRPFSLGDAVQFGKFYPGSRMPSPVILGHYLTRVELSDDALSVKALVFHADGERVTVPITPRQTVVLALGGIGNAHILLQPDEQGEQIFRRLTPEVGVGICEHPHVYKAGAILARKPMFTPPPESFGRYVANIVPDDALYESVDRVACAFELIPVVGEDEGTTTDKLFEYVINTRSEMLITPHNRIEIGPQNAYGVHRPIVFCTVESTDLLAVHKYLRHLAYSLGETGDGLVKINNDGVFREIAGGGHTMCTTRMSEDRRSGVVNRDCFHHEVSNLALAGSSVFSSGGAANPTMTIIALASRLAQTLRATYA